MTVARKNVAILISGRGSNMAALVAAAGERDYPAQIVGVVCDRADAAGLSFAAAEGIPTRILARSDHPSREAHDEAIDAALVALGAEIVCLAGYMRILTGRFVKKWQGRMINIHPALLPSFKGLNSHAIALAAGARIHGCTVHFVTPEADDGPIIAQAAVPVLIGDSQEALAARVLKAEHHLYPLALRMVAEGKARLENGGTVFADLDLIEQTPRSVLSSPSGIRDNVDLEHLARITP